MVLLSHKTTVMKTNKILIYDDNCPLCTWYSGAFVKCGLLPAEGRRAFSVIDPVLFDKIDFAKSRNEIPLINTVNGKVFYGIDSLLEILSQRFPLIKKIGNFKPIKWFLSKLYKFISYNRKVVVARKCSNGAIDCAPDFSYFYRIIFMTVFLIFNTTMLIPFHNVLFSGLSFYKISMMELQLAHFGLVVTNCLLACTFKKQKAIEYLGQVNMLALLVIIFLIPLLLFAKAFVMNETIVTAYLAFTAIFIFKEYLRRMDYAGILVKNRWIVSVNLTSISGFLLFLFN